MSNMTGNGGTIKQIKGGESMDKNELFLEMMELSEVEKTKLLKDAYNILEKIEDSSAKQFFKNVAESVKYK